MHCQHSETLENIASYKAAFGLATAAVLLLSGCSQKERAQTTQPQGIRQVVVRPIAIEHNLQTTLSQPAELVPFETVSIYPKETGFVQSIPVDRGSKVHKGQLLARLVAPEIDAHRAQAQAQLEGAQAQLSAAQAKLASDEATGNHLHEAAKTPGVVAGNDLLVAEQLVQADNANVLAAKHTVEAAHQALTSVATLQQYLQLTAPFDGIITERNVHPGALVGPSTNSATATPMLRLETIDHLRLVVPVPEAYVGKIPIGQKVDFTVPAFPGRKFNGVVARVSASVDQKTRTMPVEMDVWNKEGILTPGTYVQVQWPVVREGTTFMVPRTAIATDLDHSFVIVVRDGLTKWINVQTGIAKDDNIEVFGDLHPGDAALVRGTDEIRPDTQVKPVLDSSSK